MYDVFISYRRRDSSPYAGRLCDLLRLHLGEDKVFIDEDGIAFGEQFLKVIVQRLSACHIFLPVIGPGWLTVRKGLRGRLFSPNDTVRLEILVALNRTIRVIPILVGGARMPLANFLPASIAGLAAVNAKTFSDGRFREDATALANIIRGALADIPPVDVADVEAERARVARIITQDLANNRPDGPRFGTLDPDRTRFAETHLSDYASWKKILSSGPLRPLAFPEPRGVPEPILRLADTLGPAGADVMKTIKNAGQIVFHAVGSTGNIRSPAEMISVTEKMTQEFREHNGNAKPSFLFHLGDVVYMFGEAKYYYDQFYVPYRQYPAPIFAVAGNHDGMVVPGGESTLEAFMENFCAEGFHETTASRGLGRTAQIQPGVYFTLETHFVRILALYTNVLQGPGVLSDQNGAYPELNRAQLRFLHVALSRIKSEKFDGAVIIALHHNVYAPGRGGSSPGLLAELDSISQKTGVWPHLVLSGHSHNYQRYTRTVGSRRIAYIVAGAGGYGIAQLRQVKKNAMPQQLALDGDNVTLDAYHDQGYGYLRIAVDEKHLRTEYRSTAEPSSIDSITLNLKTGRLLQTSPR